MAVLDALLGREEDQLSKPAANEDKDLGVHVDLCTRRYKTLADRLTQNHRLTMFVLIVSAVGNWQALRDIALVLLK